MEGGPVPTDSSPPRVAAPPSGGRPEDESSDDFATTIRFGYTTRCTPEKPSHKPKVC